MGDYNTIKIHLFCYLELNFDTDELLKRFTLTIFTFVPSSVPGVSACFKVVAVVTVRNPVIVRTAAGTLSWSSEGRSCENKKKYFNHA